MSYYDWKKQYDALSERDRKTYDLARKAVNALGFALQNTHSDRIVEKREMESDAAMKELFAHLTGVEASKR